MNLNTRNTDIRHMSERYGAGVTKKIMRSILPLVFLLFVKDLLMFKRPLQLHLELRVRLRVLPASLDHINMDENHLSIFSRGMQDF